MTALAIASPLLLPMGFPALPLLLPGSVSTISGDGVLFKDVTCRRCCGSCTSLTESPKVQLRAQHGPTAGCHPAQALLAGSAGLLHADRALFVSNWSGYRDGALTSYERHLAVQPGGLAGPGPVTPDIAALCGADTAAAASQAGCWQ